MKEKLTLSLTNVKAAIKLFLQNTKKRHPGPIRVGFIGQYIPAWNKVEGLYRAMLNDSRFEPIVICVPPDISNHQLENPESLQNSTYEYYKSNGYPAVNALIGKDEWLNLEELGLDYVFYQRPYNYYLPTQYSSDAVCAYAKICVVLYSTMMVEEDLDICLEKVFFRNVYCYFADSQYAKKVNRKNFKIPHLLGLQKSVYFGNPAYKHILDEKDTATNAWDAIGGDFKVMWAPRWTTDLQLGGTNFFEFKDFFFTFANQYPNASVMIRPHPLAFKNFVKSGDMTEEEVVSYQQTCRCLPNVEIDDRKDYLATMWKSDVLVADISGILPEYFIMNKPLVFCASNMILEPTEFTKKMFEGCYIVNDRQELEQCLVSLMNGIDPLKEKREKIINQFFTGNVETCLKDMLDYLATS